ncbi:hypothetical protein FQA39_LY15543 [Lamprigera yunnana]|nr:hypothetical protein FQA39_LY15543 [Lamprigera yunnana]
MFQTIMIKSLSTYKIAILNNNIKLCYSLFQKLSKSSVNQKQTPRNVYLLDENDDKVYQESSSNCNKFTYRTYNCSQLQVANVGERVILCGWLEYQRMNKFIVVRDGYGHTQAIVKENDSEMQKIIKNLSFESIIKVEGTVLSRPKEMINKNQMTGEIEVQIESLTVLNKAADNLPFNLREFQKAKEALRMKYRYIDLRFSEMQKNLRMRSKFLMDVRTFLVNNCGFIEVETPTLFKTTPGGAQEFIVPTRSPGEVYSLVQSPQQFKQMLMAGAIDRYFQIARCYRDEGSRSDRQPEFTQLDVEMSFTNIDGVISLIEELLQYCWPNCLKPLPVRFPKLTYEEAMEKYGTDKPDLSFGYTIENCTDVLSKSMDLKDFGAYYLVFRKPYNHLSKSMKEKLSLLSKNCHKAKLIQSNIKQTFEWAKKFSTLFGDGVTTALQDTISITDNSVLFLSYGDRRHALELLGLVRLEYVNLLELDGCKIRDDNMHPLWLVNFPLFEENMGNLTSVHHPFTAPHPNDFNLLESEPLKVRALAFDLVLNGNEIAGGSIRIHNPQQQQLIFKLLNINQSLLQHHIDMLGSGCPPHGGIAIGIDRLLATILNTNSIRDVIAFPKTFDGRDPITGAPSPITEHDKELYHLKIVNK